MAEQKERPPVGPALRVKIMGPVVRADVPESGGASRLLELESHPCRTTNARAVLSGNMDTTLPACTPCIRHKPHYFSLSSPFGH